MLYGQGRRQVRVVKRRTIVGVEVDQLGTVLENDGDDGVLDHLAKLDVTQGAEAGAGAGHLAGDVVTTVAHGGRGLQAVFELYCKHLQLITVVKNLGDIELGNVDCGIRLFVHNKLQANLLQMLGSFAVFKIVDDATKHGIRVSDPDEGDLTEMREVGEVGNIKQRFPAGEGADLGEHVDKVVHPRVRDLPRVQRHQRELVDLHAADHAEGAEEGVRHRVFSETVQNVDLLAELLETHVGDAGVGDVHVPHAATDGVKDLLHLHQHGGAVVGVVGVILQTILKTGSERSPGWKSCTSSPVILRSRKVFLYCYPGQLRHDLDILVIFINLLPLICKHCALLLRCVVGK